ncbi:AMACR protein-like protein [Umbelopsis sp. AD052]|nr:AMACR protein-like protein [Umbelopsis sp. AD052]
MSLPLEGIKVIELSGLAPAPFAGMILADYGATVIRVDRPVNFNPDVLARHKRSIALDLKQPKAIETLRRILKSADVLLDPYRPGVLEALGLGPDVLLKDNPRLIIARLSGYGQTGAWSKIAGHDVNYLAVSGVLSLIGRHGENPFFPVNILGDFAGGGLMCVTGILMAVIERNRSGKGQIIDANLTDGAGYLASFPYYMRKNGFSWTEERGKNMLDGGAPFYEVYRTKDNKFMAVGAIEPQFYAAFIKGLGLTESSLPPQMDADHWEDSKNKFTAIFGSKTQSEWTQIYQNTDACVTPILDFNVEDNNEKGFAANPKPAPLLSRTPAKDSSKESGVLEPGLHSAAVLKEFGLTNDEIQELIKSRVVKSNDIKSSL